MYSNAKAIALLRDLGNKLSVRLAYSGTSMNFVRSGFSAADAAGGVWPYLAISENGNEAEGQPVVYIEVSAQDAVSKDIFGNDTDSYAPHLMQFAYELNSTGGPVPGHADLIACEWESINCGVRFQLKEIPNGTAVTSANVNAAAVTADVDSLYWPTKLV